MANKILLCVFLLVFLLCTSTLGCLCLVNAESAISKPSVPEFTINLVDSSYDVLPSSTVDPYTGQTSTVDGRHVEAVTLKLSIKNQQYTPFMIKQEYGEDRTVFLHYVYRWKGHFEQDWRHEYSPDLSEFVSVTLKEAQNMPEFSEFRFEGQKTSEGFDFKQQGFYETFPSGAPIDFQVKALIGYISWYDGSGVSGWMFTGEESGWSATKTVTLPDASTVAATPAPSVSPSQDIPSTDNQGANSASDLDWLQVATVALLAVIAVLLALAVFYLRKKSSK